MQRSERLLAKLLENPCLKVTANLLYNYCNLLPQIVRLLFINDHLVQVGHPIVCLYKCTSSSANDDVVLPGQQTDQRLQCPYASLLIHEDQS